MDSLSLFKVRHAELRPAFERVVFAGLSEPQWRARPHPAVNSVARLVWHLARSEDFGVSRVVAARPQLFEEGGWRERLGVPLARVGTGMTDAEVGDFSDRVELDALRAYWRAVGERTAAVLDGLRPGDLDAPLAEAPLRQQLVASGALGDATGDAALFQSLLALYTGKTKEWVLYQTGLLHHWGHRGEGRGWGRSIIAVGTLGHHRLPAWNLPTSVSSPRSSRHPCKIVMDTTVKGSVAAFREDRL